MQSDTEPGMADETVRAPAPRISDPGLDGERACGFPRRTLEDKAVRIAAKPLSDTPRGMVEEALQASGGRRKRPSRAFFAPYV